MLKVRLQGTVKDIQWFGKLLQQQPETGCLEYRNRLQIKEQTNIFVYTQK